MARRKFHKPEIYVFNSSGCHGHFLTYLIDRLSRKTPIIKTLPFNKLGNSHLDLDYSGFVKFVDSDDLPKTQLQEEKVVAIIFPKDLLYYERVLLNRALDTGTDLHSLHLQMNFIKWLNPGFYENIKNLYGYNQDTDNVPKWALRDAYKIGFLDPIRLGAKTVSDRHLDMLKSEPICSNDVKFLEVNCFFSSQKLKDALQVLDKQFGMDLDFTELEQVHNEFLSRNSILQTAPYTDKVLDAVRKKINIQIPNLDVIQQAFVYAEIERQNDFVTMPLTDTFFSNTGEIIDYIEHYPSHYKAMNPNLPKFNGIDNPFFLHRQKTK